MNYKNLYVHKSTVWTLDKIKIVAMKYYAIHALPLCVYHHAFKNEFQNAFILELKLLNCSFFYTESTCMKFIILVSDNI
jgi:hypothetical protein